MRLKQVVAAQNEANETLPDAFKGDAHAFLVTVYKDKTLDLDVRIDAAKAAVGYEKPKLSSVEANMSHTVCHEDVLGELDKAANGHDLRQ